MAIVPGYIPPPLFGDKDRTAEEKVAFQSLVGLHSQAKDPSISAIAANCGLSVRATRSAISSLIACGWVRQEEKKIAPNMRQTEAPAPVEEVVVIGNIFDKKNRVADNEGINRVIAAFVRAGLNPLYNSKEAASKAYGSPWNRRSAVKLLDLYGIAAVEELIEALGKRLDDQWRPQTKGLTELLNKWPNCERFIKNGDKKKGVII